jgi:hypothetical protein
LLAKAPGALEPVALEHRDGAVVEERRGDRPVLDGFRIALDRPAAEPRDLTQRTCERVRGDPAPSVPAVDEEARDAPVRLGAEPLLVRAPVLDSRQLVGRPELAPADAAAAPDAVVPLDKVGEIRPRGLVQGANPRG